jgi:predicted NAD/FAD-binding protein
VGLTLLLGRADGDLMPVNRACHASWNVIARSGAEQQDADICVSYGVKHLQTLPEEAPDLFVTLNCPQPPREGTIFNEMTLSHPIFSMESWHAQSVRSFLFSSDEREIHAAVCYSYSDFKNGSWPSTWQVAVLILNAAGCTQRMERGVVGT